VRNGLSSPIVNWKARWVGENDQARVLVIVGGFREFTQELWGENCYIDEFVMVSQAAHAWAGASEFGNLTAAHADALDVMVPQQ
jgi:hypothetical protein